jgi:hypothetical protein
MAITTSSSIKVNAPRFLTVASNSRGNGMIANSFGPAPKNPAAGEKSAERT